MQSFLQDYIMPSGMGRGTKWSALPKAPKQRKKDIKVVTISELFVKIGGSLCCASKVFPYYAEILIRWIVVWQCSAMEGNAKSEDGSKMETDFMAPFDFFYEPN